MSTAPTPGPEKPQAPASGYRSEAARLVAARAQVLQKQYSHDKAAAVASLAKLRRAYGQPPGADPLAWSETLAFLGDGIGWGDDAPTPAEVAAHNALTLFALHQQSQRTAFMHRPGVGLGRATARLMVARNGGGEPDKADPTMRRFHALGTATTFAEISHHARGLIGLLKSESIGLDYGMLTDDFIDLQNPRRADSVRLAWGRQFYRTQPSSPEASTSIHSEGDLE